jgi:hypothetical protein
MGRGTFVFTVLPSEFAFFGKFAPHPVGAAGVRGVNRSYWELRVGSGPRKPQKVENFHLGSFHLREST